MKLQIYGMSGCTTVKRAQTWLAANNIDHDYANYNKLDTLSAVLNTLIEASSLSKILNTNSQAFKNLDPSRQEKLLADQTAAVQEMADNPRLIKRPIAFDGSVALSGFKQAEWQRFAQS